jgi:hypothetical protein
MPTTLESLNQDCLNQIFSYFDIYQLVDIEKTCSLFKSTCENAYASKKFHKFKIELRTLRPEYLEKILDRIGPNVKDFAFSGGFIMDEKIKKTLVEGLISNCECLSKLTINYMQFDKALFDKLEKCFDTLTYLNLANCAINEQSDEILLKNDSTRNLKHLVLSGNANMSGEFFKCIENIESLNVSYCYNLRYYQFLIFMKTCKNLKSLNITGSPQLIPDDRNILEDLFLYQPNLEVLLMDNDGVEEDSQVLVKFKHLKQTSFSGKKFGT